MIKFFLLLFLRGFSITACSKLTVLGYESLEGGGPSSSLWSSLSSSESKSPRRSSRSSFLTKRSISLSESEAEDTSGSLELDCWESEDDSGPLCRTVWRDSLSVALGVHCSIELHSSGQLHCC